MEPLLMNIKDLVRNFISIYPVKSIKNSIIKPITKVSKGVYKLKYLPNIFKNRLNRVMYNELKILNNNNNINRIISLRNVNRHMNINSRNGSIMIKNRNNNNNNISREYIKKSYYSSMISTNDENDYKWRGRIGKLLFGSIFSLIVGYFLMLPMFRYHMNTCLENDFVFLKEAFLKIKTEKIFNDYNILITSKYNVNGDMKTQYLFGRDFTKFIFNLNITSYAELNIRHKKESDIVARLTFKVIHPYNYHSVKTINGHKNNWYIMGIWVDSEDLPPKYVAYKKTRNNKLILLE